MSVIQRGDEVLIEVNSEIIRAVVTDYNNQFIYTSAGCHSIAISKFEKIGDLAKKYFDKELAI